jgi:hypothetical protein
VNLILVSRKGGGGQKILFFKRGGLQPLDSPPYPGLVACPVYIGITMSKLMVIFLSGNVLNSNKFFSSLSTSQFYREFTLALTMLYFGKLINY